MTDPWVEDLRRESVDTDPRPEFKTELRAAVLAAARNEHWANDPSDRGRRRRWVLFGTAAACVAALVTGLVFVDRDRDTDPVTAPAPTIASTETSPDPETSVDLVVDDPLAISLDSWIDPTVELVVSDKAVAIDERALPAGWTVTRPAGSVNVYPNDLTGYSFSAQITTDDGASFDIEYTNDPFNTDPCFLPLVDFPGTVGDLTGATSGDAVCGPLEAGASLAVIPSDTSSETQRSALEVANSINLVHVDEIPHLDLADAAADDNPSAAVLAGSLSGISWTLTGDSSPTRPTQLLVEGKPASGSELSQTGVDIGQGLPAIDNTIAGIPGYGAIVFGHTDGRAESVIVTTSDNRTAMLPTSPSGDRSYFAVPVPDTVRVTTLTFTASDGSVVAKGAVPAIPAGFYGGALNLTPAATDSAAPPTPSTAVSESPPSPRTFVDEDGLRCVEYETSAVDQARSGVCFDDEYDELGIRTVEGGTHYPTATIIGGTDHADAVRLVIVGDGTEQDVELTGVDGWPERIFVADLPSGGAEVRLIGADGEVLASETV